MKVDVRWGQCRLHEDSTPSASEAVGACKRVGVCNRKKLQATSINPLHEIPLRKLLAAAQVVVEVKSR